MGNQAPLGTKSLWNTPGASLPGPFRSLVRHLIADGMTKEHAIATAWSRTRVWAAKGNARWVKVLAQLEAARAKAHATPNKSERRGVAASRTSNPTREVLMAGAPTKNTPPAAGGKNTTGGAGKGTGGPPPKPGGPGGAKTVADIRNAVAALKKMPDALKPKALARIRAAARGIPGALAFVPSDGAGGSGAKT